MPPKNRTQPSAIIGVDVYLEKRRTRTYVGRLTRLKNKNSEGEFLFEYDRKYLYTPLAIPLGPDLRLTKQRHTSAQLFKTLDDRIPSSKNPAYKDYCEGVGISPQEKDPLILLATIGKRGPSSFIFEPVFGDQFSAEDYRKFRKNLQLTLREFAQVFKISVAALQRLESGKTTGKDVLKRISIYANFPNVALYEISRHGGVLHEDKKRQLLDYFQIVLEKERLSEAK